MDKKLQLWQIIRERRQIMAEEKDLSKEVREFIEQLPLDDFKDSDEKNFDEAMVKWIQKNYPEGFSFDPARRNLMVKMVKKAAKMYSLIMNSPLKPYLDAVIDMKWRQMVVEYEKLGRKVDKYPTLIKFATLIFVLGYSLRSLEREAEKKGPDKNKNAKEP